MKTKVKPLLLFLIIFYFQDASAQWQALDGPYGEQTSIPFFFDSTYFAASNQGLIESTDSGKTWSHSNVSFYNNNKCVLNFKEGKLIYVLYYDTVGWISLDSGKTWSQMNSTGSEFPYHFEVWNGAIYALCSYGLLFKSIDNGITWSGVNTPSPTTNQIEDFSIDSGRLYQVLNPIGSGTAEVYYSDDDGATWQTLPKNGINLTAYHPYQLIANGSQLFLSCTAGLYKSNDGGNNWNLFDTGLPANYSYFYHYTRIYKSQGKIYAFVNNKGGLFSSDTSSAGFTDISNGLPAAVYISGMTENNNTLYAASPSGLFATDKNIINWQLSEKGIHFDYYFSLGSVDSALFVGGEYAMHVSHDNGATFVDMPTGEYTYNIYCNNNTVYAASAEGYKSIDGGYTWTGLNFPYGFFGQNLIDFFVMNNYFFGLNMGDRSVKYSTDSGATWNLINGLPPNNVRSIAGNNSKIFAGTSNGIYQSLNYGTTWSISLTGNIIYKILIDNGNIYAMTANKIWLSQNNGSTWVDMNYPGPNLQAITVRNDTLVASPGLYFTYNFGTNWTFLPEPVTTSQYNPYILLLTNSYLFAVIDSIYKLPLAAFTGIDEINNHVCDVLLSPNPVSNNLQIQLLNEKISRKIEIKIFDLTGRIVFEKILSNVSQKKIDINVDCLTSGLYFLEVVYNNQRSLKKFVKG